MGTTQNLDTTRPCGSCQSSRPARSPRCRQGAVNQGRCIHTKESARPFRLARIDGRERQAGAIVQAILQCQQACSDEATEHHLLVPLGVFGGPEEQSAPMGAVARAPDPAVLAECVETWFGGMRVKTLPPIASTGHLTQRIGMEGQVQLLTGDIHDQLKKLKPKDAFCIVGYTMIDLYPRKEWNFVFGQARSDTGTGIFSFARYAHCESSAHFLRRCCSVLVHEIGHLFGLAHCVWYECNMNGSNHDEESDSRPLHLCPVELHKLYHRSVGNWTFLCETSGWRNSLRRSD